MNVWQNWWMSRVDEEVLNFEVAYQSYQTLKKNIPPNSHPKTLGIPLSFSRYSV